MSEPRLRRRIVLIKTTQHEVLPRVKDCTIPHLHLSYCGRDSVGGRLNQLGRLKLALRERVRPHPEHNAARSRPVLRLRYPGARRMLVHQPSQRRPCDG